MVGEVSFLRVGEVLSHPCSSRSIPLFLGPRGAERLAKVLYCSLLTAK